MYKISRNTLRKTTKHLMVISAIATLLIAAMSLTTTMYVNAFNFGLKSNDVNSGSIDTDSLFSCVGAAIAYVNTNQDNNNVVANNGASQPNEPPTCEECFTNNLTPEEIAMLEDAGFVGVEQACATLSGLTPEDLVSLLTSFETGLVSQGIDADTAKAVVDCLLEFFQ